METAVETKKENKPQSKPIKSAVSFLSGADKSKTTVNEGVPLFLQKSDDVSEFEKPSSQDNSTALEDDEDSLSHAETTPPFLQTKLTVSDPGDKFEQEADRVSAKIMRMSVSQNSISYIKTSEGASFRQVAKDHSNEKLSAKVISHSSGEKARDHSITPKKIEKQLHRQADDQIESPQVEEEIQRESEDETEERPQVEETLSHQSGDDEIQAKAKGPNVPSDVSTEIGSAKSGGVPLPMSVRKFMEPRFHANFSDVKIHDGSQADKLNKQVNAKAFAVDNHIFFGKGQYQPDTDYGKGLLAHELTHTIQQGGAIQPKVDSPPVTEKTSSKVQRLGISDALDYIADKLHFIPGFRMFTVVLGVNPVNMSPVDRSPGNIFRALLEFIPGAALITQALDNHGAFGQVSDWVSKQIKSLKMAGSSIRDALMDFLDSLSWRDILSLGGVWRRAKKIFTDPIDRIKAFARNAYNGIVGIIKKVILRPLAKLAKSTLGSNYTLLTAVLGFDPISGETVERTPEIVIGGFMRLIGQEEVWKNLQKSNAIPRAWAWFKGVLGGILKFVVSIPGKFVAALQSLTIEDILIIPKAFLKLGKVFVGFVGSFISWAGGKVFDLLRIIFEVVAPGALPFINRGQAVFRTIIKNPIGFVGNLVRAGKLGFQRFSGRFLEHLKGSVIGWLTGTMEGTGVHIPQEFSFHEILKFTMSVMGLTWKNVRGKLVRVVGETAVGAMEQGFEIVKTLVTEGPAAAWKQIAESVSNLKEMVMEQIMSYVSIQVVQAAITKLVTSLNPAGAFIQAILAIYNTILFFVERLSQIGRVVSSFVKSIGAIAAGNIGAAASRVEKTMAGMLTLVVSFLARFAGLGKVSDSIKDIINRVREPIDKALDSVVSWIVRQARKLGGFVAQAGVPKDPNERLRLAGRAAVGSAKRLQGRVTHALLKPALAGIRTRYGLTSIEPFEKGDNWWVRAKINPVVEVNTETSTKDKAEGGVDGVNYQPLIGKLGQAITMYELFDERDPDQTFKTVKNSLKAAKKDAEALHALRESGSKRKSLETKRKSLRDKLQALRTMDPKYKLISIGEMSVTVINSRKTMNEVRPAAFDPSDKDADYIKEYKRQLSEQQDGINSLLAFQWKDNRKKFKKHGRSSVGRSLQREFGKRTGAGRAEGTAAPHNADQIAGGFDDPTGSPAVARVNSSIGPSWRSRVGTIDNAVKTLSAEDRQVSQMNVRLTLNEG